VVFESCIFRKASGTEYSSGTNQKNTKATGRKASNMGWGRFTTKVKRKWANGKRASERGGWTKGKSQTVLKRIWMHLVLKP
jgi:hypothetical protein